MIFNISWNELGYVLVVMVLTLTSNSAVFLIMYWYRCVVLPQGNRFPMLDVCCNIYLVVTSAAAAAAGRVDKISPDE